MGSFAVFFTTSSTKESPEKITHITHSNRRVTELTQSCAEFLVLSSLPPAVAGDRAPERVGLNQSTLLGLDLGQRIKL